jgi:hypothetical protein
VRSRCPAASGFCDESLRCDGRTSEPAGGSATNTEAPRPEDRCGACEWAWADSNGRPHAYQAAPGGSGTPQPVTKTQTGRAICQRSPPPLRDRARHFGHPFGHPTSSCQASSRSLPSTVPRGYLHRLNYQPRTSRAIPHWVCVIRNFVQTADCKPRLL